MPAVIGLIGTIVGSSVVLITQLTVERQKQAVEIQHRRQDKLVELISALYEHKRAFGRDEAEALVIKIAPIVHVYFPQFERQFEELQDSVNKYKAAFVEHSSLGAQGRGAESLPRVHEAEEAYNRSFHSMLDEISKYAGREFQ